MWALIVYWVLRLLTKVVLNLRVYYYWSRLGRWLFEYKYLDKPIPEFKDLTELSEHVREFSWRADPWWQGFDMISCPAMLEETKHDDCDGFSLYLGHALRQISQDHRGALDLVQVRCFSLLSIPWVTPNGRPGGHNVCVFEWMNRKGQWAWAHVSNWYGCSIQWMHWDGQKYFYTINDVVKEIVGSNWNLGWARASLDLKNVYETGILLRPR